MTPPSPWWSPGRHADRRGLLLARNRIKASIRAWFERQGFVEVETGCLQVSPGNETHLHAFRTERIGTDLARDPLYLHTSPEFACKKLLAAGEERIFTFAPVFRNRERGAMHAPEFTMLEWYRADEPYERLWDDCAALLAIAGEVTGRNVWQWRGTDCDVTADYRSTTLVEAFARFCDLPLGQTIGADASVDRDALAALASARGCRVAPDDDWSDIFSKLLTDRIEPRLGIHHPEILHQYPEHEAALARPHPEVTGVAERFELYVCGVELANGFGELTDAAAQRRRFEAQMDERQRRYGERYPIDEEFLAALASMPQASGCALGFDRLVMLATGAQRIDDVIWTPMAR